MEFEKYDDTRVIVEANDLVELIKQNEDLNEMVNALKEVLVKVLK